MDDKLKLFAVEIVLLLAATRPSFAAVVYDSSGFEPARFIPGVLEGQDAVSGPWSTDNNVSSATLQSATVRTGTQAVRVNRAASVNGDQRWSVFKPTTATLRYLQVAWDENVAQSSSPGVAHGPLFGVEAYDDTGGATVPLIGSTYVDSTTGEVYYQAHTTGNLVTSSATVTFGAWNHFVLQADFTTSAFQLFFNGAPIAADGFVDAGITGFSDAPLTTVAYPDGLASSNTAAGTAYFDNYAITTSATPVPEPGAVGLMAVFVSILTARVRRSRR